VKLVYTYILSIGLALIISFSSIGVSFIKEVCLPCGYENITALPGFIVDDSFTSVETGNEYNNSCCSEVNSCCEAESEEKGIKADCCGGSCGSCSEDDHQKEILPFQLKIETLLVYVHEMSSTEYTPILFPQISILSNDDKIEKTTLSYFPKIPPDISSGREILSLKSSLSI